MCSGTSKWVHISGTSSPTAANLVRHGLANGQQMFTCGDSQGKYDLTVPVDENGNVTVFGFADGFQPYSDTFVAPICDLPVMTIDGVQVLNYRLVTSDTVYLDHLVPRFACAVELTAKNTTPDKKSCGFTFTVYNLDGRFLSKAFGGGVRPLRLLPGATDTSVSLPFTPYSACTEVGRLEVREDTFWCTNGGF